VFFRTISVRRRMSNFISMITAINACFYPCIYCYYALRHCQPITVHDLVVYKDGTMRVFCVTLHLRNNTKRQMDVSFYFCSFTLFVSWEEFNPLILSVRQEVFSLTAGASSLMFIRNNVKTLQLIHMLNGDNVGT